MSHLSKRLQEMVTSYKNHGSHGDKRWLSRIDAIIFLLTYKNLNKLELKASQVVKITTTFTEINFTTICEFAEIIYPFHVLIKISEKNKSRQYKTFPLFLQFDDFHNSKSKEGKFVKKKHQHIFLALLHQINLRKCENIH